MWTGLDKTLLSFKTAVDTEQCGQSVAYKPWMNIKIIVTLSTTTIKVSERFHNIIL